ncbi:mandelate racemase/muconate lactonizing enzyme family protein [Pseudodonghicola flavimaris]|uniref:Mandelate racemase/muconate lactonizing enzyme family protein n=1 Tax=Pseudodonghicola flavimaris TaxID=3050036 RepID=A0ABT7F2J1_9RHOB|nr:mandelate racemase/muconate lactonizing enzyme family protein [Pseudodonghicola flavimaris]MDK3018807.1 mandelate racemase/muconate lactonizing enzyme family protein [Pseudodonghicola flavimaris]
MKIVKARIYLVESGGISPVLLELETEDGSRGLGEAAIAYGAGTTAAAGMVKDVLDRYLRGGVSPSDSERVWNEFYDHGFWAKGGGPVVMSGISAVEQAMVDLRARALGVPAYELLGGRVNDRLRAYCNGWYFGCTSDADLPMAAERAAAEGYGALKFYPFVEILAEGRLRHPSRRSVADQSLLRRALDRMKEIRRAVGAEVELMLDLSAGIAPDDTVRFCHALEEVGISFIEEPTVPGDTRALAEVKRAIPQSVAVGERLYSRYGFRDVLEARAADILQPDVGNTGGLMEARRIAAMAEAYGLKVQPHICASALSTAVGMHFSAAVPNFYWQEHFPYWARIPGHVDVIDDPVEDTVKNGVIPVNDRPGFGVSLRREVAENWLWAELDLI